MNWVTRNSDLGRREERWTHAQEDSRRRRNERESMGIPSRHESSVRQNQKEVIWKKMEEVEI